MNKLGTTLAAAALGLAASTANATLIDDTSAPGILVTSGTPGDGDLLAGDSGIVSMTATGTFADSFEFTLPTPGTFSAAALNLDLSPSFAIADFSADLYDATGTLVASFAPVSSTPVVDTYSFTGVLGGDYALVVSGTATGTIGGSYGVGYEVAPVPEPKVWFMLLLGLGVVAFGLRRSQRRLTEFRPRAARG